MNKLRITIFSAFAILVMHSTDLTAQIYGCTDQNANNYNPVATDNDGSCTYNFTIYNPPVRYILPDEVNETSGLAYFVGKLWTINDSGGLPALYAFDTITGEIEQIITIAGATNVDWESLADDDEYIYIGDFGNNSGNRDNLAIYRALKADIPSEGNATIVGEKTTFAYSDYSGRVAKRSENDFDCEAFIATADSLFLFSKNHKNQKTKLYKLPKVPGDYVAELVTTFNSSGLITGADINLNTNEITLIGYVKNEWTPFTWLLFDYDGNNFFSGNKRRIDLLNIIATQTEAIAYTVGKHEVITSEAILFAQTAYDFNSGLWTNDDPTAVEDIQSAKFDFVLSPNPVSKKRLNIKIEKLPVGEYQIEIYDAVGRLVKVDSYSVARKDGTSKIRIKVDDYASGAYFVRMSSGSRIVEKKFIRK